MASPPCLFQNPYLPNTLNKVLKKSGMYRVSSNAALLISCLGQFVKRANAFDG